MREYNALEGYPEPREPRFVGPNLRTIQHRIVASYRNQDFYDGERCYGYGGLKYDGRWRPIAARMYAEYQLKPGSAVLHIGCDKGFLLNDFVELDPQLKVRGTELSRYAIAHAMPRVQQHITLAPFTALPFEDQEFDLVIALGSVYTLNLPDAITCLREIERVGKGKSFITLASYTTEEELRLFRYWSLLGTTILMPEEWRQVLRHVEYRGDYYLTSARTLNLRAQNA